ncbi:polysaccharide pyruvyl transferase family protein [Neisseria shayeganii]|nr:polysaccharide pyruvyl transferase family protein [Neisseria shayeganii]
MTRNTTPCSAMQELKQKLNFIADLIIDKNDVVYLDYPFHLNVGDLLIYHGTEEFFKQHNIQVKFRRPWTSFNIKELRYIITPNTTILCHGGGNFGDLYSVTQRLREAVIQTYPSNRIIVFPQTAFFKNKQTEKSSAEIFRQHNDCHLFARDEPTFYLMEKFSENVYLSPDMAHQLYGKLKKSHHIKNETLFFLRKDIEKTNTEAVLTQVAKRAQSTILDWPDTISISDKAIWNIQFKFLLAIRHLKMSNIKNCMNSYWHNKSLQLMHNSSLLFSEYQEVVTTRLHGHILSCLLDIPNTVYDNSYGKNKGYFDLWTNKVRFSQFKRI